MQITMDSLLALHKRTITSTPHPTNALPTPLRPPAILSAEIKAMSNRWSTIDANEQERGIAFLNSLGVGESFGVVGGKDKAQVGQVPVNLTLPTGFTSSSNVEKDAGSVSEVEHVQVGKVEKQGPVVKPSSKALDLTRTFKVKENYQAMDLETFLERVHESDLNESGDEMEHDIMAAGYVDAIDEESESQPISRPKLALPPEYSNVFSKISFSSQGSDLHPFFRSIADICTATNDKDKSEPPSLLSSMLDVVDGLPLPPEQDCADREMALACRSVWKYIASLVRVHPGGSNPRTHDFGTIDLTGTPMPKSKRKPKDMHFHNQHLSGGKGYIPLLNERILRSTRQILESEFDEHLQSACDNGDINQKGITAYLNTMYPGRVESAVPPSEGSAGTGARIIPPFAYEDPFPQSFEMETVAGTPVWVFAYLVVRAGRYEELGALDRAARSIPNYASSGKVLHDALLSWARDRRLPFGLRERVAREFHINKRTGGDPYKRSLLNLVGRVQFPTSQADLGIGVTDWDFLWWQQQWVDPDIPDEDMPEVEAAEAVMPMVQPGTFGPSSSPSPRRWTKERSNSSNSSQASLELSGLSLGWLQRSQAVALPPLGINDATVMRCYAMVGSFSRVIEILLSRQDNLTLLLHAIHLSILFEVYGLVQADIAEQLGRVNVWNLMQAFFGRILGGCDELTELIPCYTFVLAGGVEAPDRHISPTGSRVRTSGSSGAPVHQIQRIEKVKALLLALILQFGPVAQLFGSLHDDGHIEHGLLSSPELISSLRLTHYGNEKDDEDALTFANEILIPAALALQDRVLGGHETDPQKAMIATINGVVTFLLAHQQASAMGLVNVQLQVLVEAAAKRTPPGLGHLARSRVDAVHVSSMRHMKKAPKVHSKNDKSVGFIEFVEQMLVFCEGHARSTNLLITTLRALRLLNIGRMVPALELIMDTDLLPNPYVRGYRADARQSLVERVGDGDQVPFFDATILLEIFVRFAEVVDSLRQNQPHSKYDCLLEAMLRAAKSCEWELRDSQKQRLVALGAGLQVGT